MSPAAATNGGRPRVSLVRCASTSADADVVSATVEAIERLGGGWAASLAGARTVAVKINAGIARAENRTDGRQTELTDPAVVEGTIRALRAATDAVLLVGDAATDGGGPALYAQLGLPDRLARYPGVRVVDFNASEIVDAMMTHPDPMFRCYRMPREIVEADAVVTVAKMKAHQGMGCTLGIKNLFGWLPTAFYGSPRTFLHDRMIRLPRVLADLALWLRPCLTVVDGIVAQNKSEWGGEPLRPGVLLAGGNVVATDSVGMRVMGFDPSSDFPEHPFLYRRNAVLLAARAGLGPTAASDIEVIGPALEEVRTEFTVRGYGDAGETPLPERIARRAAELERGLACVDLYRDRQAALANRYGDGRYLALYDGDVLWDAVDVATIQNLWWESGREWHDSPQLIVRCLRPEDEEEQFDRYAEDVTAMIAAARPAQS